VFARRTLVASGQGSLADRIARADAWLARVEVHNVPDAAAIVFAFNVTPDVPPGNWRAAVELLKKGQGRDGGWGPYVTSPAEPFDTAIATLALHGLMRRPSRPGSSFTNATLADAIARGRAYLVREQLADGSWSETTRPSGQTSYAQRISTTGWALLALIETAASQ
jgi:hypothetical protein